MLYLESSDGFLPWSGEPLNSYRHPLNIEQLWTADELAAVGLYAPERPDVPAGKRVVSETVQRVGGVVKYVYQLEDVPEEFAALEPWQFWAVVNLPGSIGESNLRAAIGNLSNAVFRVVALAKLNNPPGGRYLRSDPLFNDAELMTALGINSAMIDTLWRQAEALNA